ncbi:MAG: hypothetical protein AAF202_12350, partial [Pseudomonadota bacterium]
FMWPILLIVIPVLSFLDPGAKGKAVQIASTLSGVIVAMVFIIYFESIFWVITRPLRPEIDYARCKTHEQTGSRNLALKIAVAKEARECEVLAHAFAFRKSRKLKKELFSSAEVEALKEVKNSTKNMGRSPWLYWGRVIETLNEPRGS